MAWTTVETPNANYILVFTRHKKTINSIPKSFDAAVLESGDLSPTTAAGHESYVNLVRAAAEKGKQVWITDVPLSQAAERRDIAKTEIAAFVVGISAIVGTAFLLRTAGHEKLIGKEIAGRMLLGIGLLSPFLSYVLAISGHHNKQIKWHSLWKLKALIAELAGDKGVVQVRNLISAEKVESFLAKRLKQELGRKPTIVMFWGTAHYNLRNLLKHPEQRQRMLKGLDIAEYVAADYPKSYRISLNKTGKIENIEEFHGTFKIEKAPAKKLIAKDRWNLRRIFMRRRAV